MIDKNLIESIANEALKNTGVFLVDILVSRGNVIQVFIDHNRGVSLDECVALHRAVEEKLDRDQEDFELQVSSPGLGQPIRVFQQYVKEIGQKLEIVTEEGDTFRATLLEARPAEAGKGAELVVSLIGTKRKPASGEPVIVETGRIKTARVVIDFKQV